MEQIYLDTEFDGFGGPLISIGMVAETATGLLEFYGILSREVKTPWAIKNVVPKLLGERYTIYTPYDEVLKIAVQHYLMTFENPKIICDFFEDAKHFLDMLGGSAPGSSLKYECTIKLVKSRTDHYESQHNALADARALREWYIKEEA